MVDDGDVEPNPGPHEASSCLQACMVNAGGAANTWAFARLDVASQACRCGGSRALHAAR